MSYNQLREECFFKTGREGVVLEVIDLLRPNLFDNNKKIDNAIFNKDSKIRFTLVDARKATGKGKAIYYNLDPNEVVLLDLLLSDGQPNLFKKRVGAYNALSGPQQIYIRNIVGTFNLIDFSRFDNMMDYSNNPSGTSITLQKNINISGDKLLIRKFILSYEEAMRSASKWKVAIETGEGIKDTSKGNGLNIVQNGTYKVIDKTFLMLQLEEVVIPVNEAAKRVIISQTTFYSLMKKAEDAFTKKKMETKDYSGDRIDEWNPQGKPKWANNENVGNKELEEVDGYDDAMSGENANSEQAVTSKVTPPQDNKIEKKTEEKQENKCHDCGIDIDSNVYNYSVKFLKMPLCIKCQKNHKK